MSKQKSLTANGSFFSEIFHVGLYKRSQGKLVRQVTGVALLITFALAALSLRSFIVQHAGGFPEWTERFALSLSLPGLLMLVGIWLSYRIVNYPRFADFLIAVEAEMNKVSWPSRGELIRASIVVIVVIAVLAAVLFGYDLFWTYLFERWLGIIYTGE